MIIDSKPRDFSYLNHKENFPLQIRGNMKRRSRPHSSTPINNNISIKENNLKMKDITPNRILDNYQDLKSVLPIDLTLKRPQSIKTFNRGRPIEISGAALLMVKSSTQKDHPQKKHLSEWNLYSRYVPEPRNKERRHYMRNNEQSLCQQESVKIPKKHSQTLHRRLQNDIYSQIQVKQNILHNNTVKMGKRNMFTESINLGLEQYRQPKISCAKMKEVFGSAAKPDQSNSRYYRQDWRKSNIDLC